MSQIYFCIFCRNKEFFKLDLKQHIITKHMNNKFDPLFTQLIDSLISYCSKLENTLKLKPKCLPKNNVQHLLIGCPLCNQIIDYYQLKGFDRNEKLFKDCCICGLTEDSDSNNCLVPVHCSLCKHFLHFECAEGQKYSGQDLSSYLCQFCRTRTFSIETYNDMKPLEVLKHFLQHFNYKPFKCDIDQNCGQNFYNFPSFIEHLKCGHNMTENMIKNSKNNLYSYEKIVEIEELLEMRGIKNGLMAFDFNTTEENTKNNTNDNQSNENRSQTPIPIIHSVRSIPTTTITEVTEDASMTDSSSIDPIPSTSAQADNFEIATNDSQNSHANTSFLEQFAESTDDDSSEDEIDTITTENNNNSQSVYQNFKKLCVKLGHVSCVYCVTFDRTGKHIITGSDDYLVKIWSSADGRLISTLRGHMSEVKEISVNYENTLLASGDISCLILIWCLKTAKLLTTLKSHTKRITSLKFCPLCRTDNRYLVSTGNDGRICFWKWNVKTNQFQSSPDPLITEQHTNFSSISCSSFSSGGHLFAVGSANLIGIYTICTQRGPKMIFEKKQHWGRVDRIQFSNNSLRFVSASHNVCDELNVNKYDAFIWYFDKSSWNVIPIKTGHYTYETPIVEIAWTSDDEYIVASLTDHSIKIWRSSDGELIQVLREHNDKVHCLQTHPIDENVFISAGYDSKVIIWDIRAGSPIKKFKLKKGRAILGSSFSSDGLMMATTDCCGQLSLFGCSDDSLYKGIPKQLYFHTDYHPLISTNQNTMIVDEETKEEPHLLPVPFLVNLKGVPYQHKQNLVPGRENCSEDQNEPYIRVCDTNRFILEPVIKYKTLLPTNSQLRSEDGNLLPSDYKISQLLWILRHRMLHKDMFATLFLNYIKLAQKISQKTAVKLFDLISKLMTNQINSKEFCRHLKDLILSPPQELYLPVLENCLPLLRKSPVNDRALNGLDSAESDFKISSYNKFLQILSKVEGYKTRYDSVPSNAKSIINNETVPKITAFRKNIITGNSSISGAISPNIKHQSSAHSTTIKANTTSKQLPENIMKCCQYLSLKLLLSSIQPQEVAANIKLLIHNLIDGSIGVDKFIIKIKEELEFQITGETDSQFLRENLPQLRLLMNKNEIQIEDITAPPLLPPGNLLFEPKKQTEHNHFNPRYEESVDEGILFLSNVTANEKWKVALRRPGNWLSFGFNKTLDSVWSQRNAVTQLANEQLNRILNQLKQKEINEIEMFEMGCKKRQLESLTSLTLQSVESVNNTSVSMTDNQLDSMISGPSHSRSSESRLKRSHWRLSQLKSPKRHRSLARDLFGSSELPIDLCMEWATETNCVKSPYYPQLGDEVVYFREGHQEYIDAMNRSNLRITGSEEHEYTGSSKNVEVIFAKVVAIQFEANPVHLVQLKLVETTPNTNEMALEPFTVCYHRIEGISDFIILRQLYEKSIKRKWIIGDECRTTTDCGNYWRFGAIVNKIPSNDHSSKSLFKKFVVNMTDNVNICLSPWDLEPLDHVRSRLPPDRSIVPLIDDERLAFYEPKAGEWPECGREAECDRLERGFACILEMSDAFKFTSEGNVFKEPGVPKPPYPIDLSIITARIKNRFYRRLEQIKFDISKILSNVVKYLCNSNQFIHDDYSDLFIKARLIKNVCLDFIDNTDCYNPISIYEQKLVDKKRLINTETVLGDTEWSQSCSDFHVRRHKWTNESSNKDFNDDSDDDESQVNENDVEIIQIADRIMDKSQQQFDEVQRKVEQKIQTEIQSEAQPEIQAVSQTEAQSEIVHNFQQATQKAQTEPILKIQSRIELEIQPEIQPRIESEIQLNMQSETEKQPEIQNEMQPKVEETEIKIEIKTEIRDEVIEDLEELSQATEPNSSQYFCIFCRENTYFVDKNEAFDHYRLHLVVVLKCGICYSSFDDIKEFLSHNTEHSRIVDSLVNTKDYDLSRDWINSFLDFQLTDRFRQLARNSREFCPVCHVIKTNCQLLVNNSAIAQDFSEIFSSNSANDEPFVEHIRKHLNCENVFECLKCLNVQKSKFSFSLSEAKNHLLRSHESTGYNSSTISHIRINDYFLISQSLSPKLQLFIDKLTKISDSILKLDESYSID